MDCTSLVFGLQLDDCQYMQQLSFIGQGVNAMSNNGKAWIGDDGPYTFSFRNTGDRPSALVLWIRDNNTDYVSFDMTHKTPDITYSLVNATANVTISMPANVNGAFSTLDDHNTALSNGQIFNTWGEFSTGVGATVDVSREVNMDGSAMSIHTSNGCVSDMDICVFKCKNGNTCGEQNTYSLDNCAYGSQTGAAEGVDKSTGDPSGGCGGWGDGGEGHVDISLG